jgi:long-subunit acyl-CoA synthetase (AMP-forming)
MKDIILNSYKKYAKLPALGTIVTKDNKPTIEYLTYKEAIDQAHYVGSGIIH